MSTDTIAAAPGVRQSEAGRLSMGTTELAPIILGIVNTMGPLRFRQIEAHVVLKGVEVSTYEVQRAIAHLADRGELKQTDDFRYTTGGAVAAK
jgi:hypothetical protein